MNRFNVFTWVKDLNIFTRKLKWHKFFKVQKRNEALGLGIDPEDVSGVLALTELLEEN